MSFRPVIPSGGYGGWAFLNRTIDKQQQTFNRSPALMRDSEYFRKNIAKVKTADDLVADRRLLRIALGAFGLQDDLNSKFFIKKVLEGGVENPKSLANRLADKRYFEMASAFGFGGTGAAAVTENGFADKIIGLYQSRSFEVAVGESDENLRLALGLRRDLAALARKDASEDTKWFTIMGAAPLRKVFEVAFSLPKSFGTIDIDKQLETLKQKSRQAFGDASVSQFADPERIEALTRRFLLRADLAAVSQQFSGGSIALQLLQSARFQR